MNNLFKTTLVAASIAALSGVANAGTLETSVVNYSTQGATAAAAADTQTVSFNHTVDAGFAINDLITYTLPAGTVSANWPATVTFAADATKGKASMVATLLSQSTDKSVASYRVTTVTANVGETTIGAKAPIALVLKTTALTADVTVGVVSKLSNGITEIDAGTKSVKLVDSKDQLGDIKATTPFDATISVAAKRKAFKSGTTDALVWTTTNDTSLTGKVTVAKSVVTLNGDFTGMKSADFASANGTAVYVDADKALTVTYTGNVTTDTITVTPLAGNKAVVLNAQDFTVSSVATFGTTAESLGSASAGSWKLDGAVVNVPYMPYGNNISQILYVSNAGSLTGDISVTAFDSAGMSYDLGVIAVSEAGKITKITSEVKDALEAKGFTSGKVSLTVTVNAQDKDVTVYGSYSVGGADRGFVNTSQYKGK
jgi:hypothetical protein